MTILHSNSGFPTNSLLTGRLVRAGRFPHFLGSVALPDALLDLDFSTPTVQSFPDTAFALSLVVGADATSIYNFEEASGDALDLVASNDLSPNNSPLQNRTATGLWDGTDFVSKKAIEITDGTINDFRSASSSVFDYDASTSFAFLFVFRMSPDQTGSQSLLSNWSGGVGYDILTSAAGLLQFNIDDGANTGSRNVSGVQDGAWHCALVVCNRTTNLLHSYTDTGESTDDDISSVGSLSNGGLFKIGPWTSSRQGHFQMAYLAVFEGAEAESLDANTITSFWKHATDPTGELTTIDRDCLISVPLSATTVGHFAPDQLPIGYHPAFSSGYGLYCNNALTNYLPYSEDLTQWTTGGSVTVTESDADAPDGFLGADTISKTAGTQYGSIWDTTATLTAGQIYTVSAWVKRNSGSGPSIEVRDSGDTQEYASRHLSLLEVDTWTRVALHFVADATAGAAYLIRLRPSPGALAETASASFWGVEVKAGYVYNEVGAGAGPYIRTTGSSESLVESNYRVADVLPTDTARLVADFVYELGTGNDQFIFDTESNTDRRSAWINESTPGFEGEFRDDGDSAWFTVGSASDTSVEDTVYQLIARWDIDAGDFPDGSSYTATYHIDGASQQTADTDTTSASEAVRDILVGRSFSSGYSLDGFIQSIKVYDVVGSAPVDNSTPAQQIGVDFWTTEETIEFDTNDVGDLGLWAVQDYTAGGWTRVPGNAARNDPYYELTVSSTTTSGAEIATTASDYLNGSYRCSLKAPAVYGTVSAFFYYASDTEEIDIEILSRENEESVAHFVVHENDGDTHKFVPLGFDPSAAFHEYRFDWYSDRVEFYVDGVKRAEITENIPTTAGSILANHWSTADASWADGPPASDAVMQIEYITLYSD